MSIELYSGDYRNCEPKTMTPRGVTVITDPPYEIDADFYASLPRVGSYNQLYFCKPERQYFSANEYLFWIKTPSTKNYKRNCGRFVEMILVLRGEGAPFNQLHWSQMTGVYDDRLITPPVHPHEKPLSLMERLVRIYTNPGDTVFDPFMGSGTTGVACKNLGRNFVGCEINPEYFEIAKNRILNFQYEQIGSGE